MYVIGTVNLNINPYYSVRMLTLSYYIA